MELYYRVIFRLDSLKFASKFIWETWIYHLDATKIHYEFPRVQVNAGQWLRGEHYHKVSKA